MFIPVFEKYVVQEDEIVPVLVGETRLPKIKKWYHPDDEPLIYTGFEKIVDEKSLLKFIHYYGLPGIEPRSFFTQEEAGKMLPDDEDQLLSNKIILSGEIANSDSIKSILEEAKKLRKAHFIIAQALGLSVDNEIRINRLVKFGQTNYYEPFSMFKGSERYDDIKSKPDVLNEFLRLEGSRHEYPIWTGNRFINFTKYDNILSAIWQQFYRAITRTDRTTKQCPECGILHEWFKDYCSDGITKISSCYNRATKRNARKGDE